MNKSEQINELAMALSKAQAKIAGAIKDSANPFYKSKYADLAGVWDVCRIPLSDNGLSVIQTTEIQGERIILNTTLLHSSGQWVSGAYPVKPQKDDPQGCGSALSYARRYTLSAMVGVFQIDDDAESAMKREPEIKQVTKVSKGFGI